LRKISRNRGLEAGLAGQEFAAILFLSGEDMSNGVRVVVKVVARTEAIAQITTIF